MRPRFLDRSELHPIKEFIEQGKLPMTIRCAQRLSAAGVFPALKVAGIWNTTETWIDSFYKKRLNAAAQKLVA